MLFEQDGLHVGARACSAAYGGIVVDFAGIAWACRDKWHSVCVIILAVGFAGELVHVRATDGGVRRKKTEAA